jgi:hypothetical protein
MRGTMSLFRGARTANLEAAPPCPGRLELNSFVTSSEFDYTLRGSASLT